MVAAPLATTSEREEVMDFSYPLYIDVAAFLYKRDTRPILESFLFVRPYKWQVWICVGLIIPVIVILIWMFSQAQRYILMMQNKETRVSPLLPTFWTVIGILLRNGT